MPDGTAIDFFAVLDQKCSAGADSEENGFREIVRLVGRSITGTISDEKWNLLYEKLNLNSDNPPQFHYERLPLGIASSLSRDEISEENLEQLERWVTEMETAISAVAEALKRPLYIIPTVGKSMISSITKKPQFFVHQALLHGLQRLLKPTGISYNTSVVGQIIL